MDIMIEEDAKTRLKLILQAASPMSERGTIINSQIGDSDEELGSDSYSSCEEDEDQEETL